MYRRLPFAILTVAWLSVIACGMAAMWSYNHRPGVPANASARWPDASRLCRSPGYPTLILLAHPKCPCTRATIEELSKLMAHTQGRLTTYVLFVSPSGAPADWSRTDLWNSASRIPGVQVLTDENGVEAERFDAHVSGQALLYDSRGGLVFQGGITESRGQIGDNPGRAAIESIVNLGRADRDSTAVFGCPLFNPDSECRKPGNATYNRFR